MKTLIILLLVVLFTASCSECKFSTQTRSVAVKYCSSQQWDTIAVPVDAALHISNWKTAVPELCVSPANEDQVCYVSKPILYNVCEFRYIKQP